MASLQFISFSSQASLPHSTAANYARIPSWVSLKSSNFSLETPSTRHHQGELENVHLVSLSKHGKLEEAHEFVLEMDRSNVPVSPQSYKHLLEACSRLKSLHFGKLIHRRLNDPPPRFLVNYVVQMYCDCGSLSDARKVFDEMRERALGSGITLISAYADKGLTKEALEIFLQVKDSDNVVVIPTTYLSVLKSFVDSSYLEVGKQIHCHVIKAGFTSNVAIDTAICNMYAKCRNMESAEMNFRRMLEKNTVSWTTMMVGYTLADRHVDTLKYLIEMMEERHSEVDEFVFSITLKACVALGDHSMGEQIHGMILKHGMETDVSVGTPLVDFYVKCGSMESALRAFERISEPNDASWSAILCGYSQTGEFERGSKLFKSLRSESSSLLNECTYTSVFQLCSSFADFSFGSQLHGDAIKRALISQPQGESTLITMYAKCGFLESALRIFESIDEPDTVAWTAIISGCASHGKALEALNLFEKMHSSGIRANEVTFVAVFTACSHAGLVDEAKRYLETMTGEYGVEPNLDHYNCAVDVYARAGLLNEAMELMDSMPFQPDAMSWKSLLGGCTIHKNDDLGKVAAEKLLHMDPEDTAAYILLFNLHVSCGNWDEAGSIRKLMADRGLTKEVACSWINVNRKVHRFVVGDRRHHRTEEIYSMLKELNFPSSRNDVSTEEYFTAMQREQSSDVHSERLAVAFGLISTRPDSPVVVFKNLRACRDCHEFCKYVSMAVGRTVVVRDTNRFHEFKSGNCSCGDYCAFYQLHLVKSETAREFIPKEFRLVEAFGYTLGGFFLANYEDSPVGKFDELVVIAGTVWNPPTSCAWAARVLVSNDEACIHGRKEVGLPSHVAIFSKKSSLESTSTSRNGGFAKSRVQYEVDEINGGDTAMSLCKINFPSSGPLPTRGDAEGLDLKFSLPSFSGRTMYNPRLLKYSCRIKCSRISDLVVLIRLRSAPVAEVSAPCHDVACSDRSSREVLLTMSVMLSKPILALKFNRLKMTVEAPSVVSE
ncbi:hypothetical protein M569_06531 [Genlisea aurea]|uniref:DYW domain-containing protein n=1 Tax=Genlisea aurea TaxID=192259 RepID=S8E744_9LAMI|nr:hypothetical protein M569_06531 [Genlisea aurea]